MADSFITYTGDGSTTIFSIPFGYLTTDHLTATVDGVTTAVTFPTSGQFEFSTAPGNATAVTLTRNTPRNTREVVWQDAANLSAGDLNTSDLQLLYVTQEAFDAATNNISLVSDDTFDALNKRIKNLATPVNPTDAATKAYADSTLSLTNADVASAEAAKDAAELAKTGAETAESSAQTVLAQMQILYDDWDDRYLGSKTADPSLDNDGDALEDGALYFNEISNQLRVYDLGSTTWLIFDAVIPDNTITNNKMADDSVGSDEIIDGSVVFSKVASSLVGTLGDIFSGLTTKFVTPAVLKNYTQQYAYITHEEPSGTSGGSHPAGSWIDRVFNTVVTNNISGLSLNNSTGVVTIPAGTYKIKAGGQLYYSVYNCMARLYNITDSTTIRAGMTTCGGYLAGSNIANAVTAVNAKVNSGETTFSVSTEIKLQTRSTQTRNTDGQGQATNFGEPETYAEIEIWKIS